LPIIYTSSVSQISLLTNGEIQYNQPKWTQIRHDTITNDFHKTIRILQNFQTVGKTFLRHLRNNRQTWPFSTLTIKNRDYVALSLALLVYRANENRKHCTLFSEVTQKDLKYINIFKIHNSYFKTNRNHRWS
jgi:hypothetical protein